MEAADPTIILAVMIVLQSKFKALFVTTSLLDKDSLLNYYFSGTQVRNV